ncbi:MAG TPA: Asp-tRNA(Asn)/Glu-tRNA(Gln) amidotransferase subunit GatC [Candidatus Kapabacteria bacterium]|nr:Asp-tRNA(Asn)/Glu-tRNA(Gln) amidotransferase subunit GatC [Candidatus Kapabacteria bacterium]
MTLSLRDIEQVATLARLNLTEEEKKRYADQISSVLAYIEMLQEVDTVGVPETCQVTGLEDVMREDVVEVQRSEVRKKIIASFPEKVGDVLKVKAVFE